MEIVSNDMRPPVAQVAATVFLIVLNWTVNEEAASCQNILFKFKCKQSNGLGRLRIFLSTISTSQLAFKLELAQANRILTTYTCVDSFLYIYIFCIAK